MKNLIIALILLLAVKVSFAQKGKIYPNFPEKFETEDPKLKTTYKKGTVQLKSGTWTFDQAILGNTENDLIKGKQAVRMQKDLEEPSLVQMDFDLPSGASKVSFVYGSYGKDPSCTFILEYSTDQGGTWTKHDRIINDSSKDLGTATYKFDIKGPVRFRIHKVGMGVSEGPVKNGRLNIDDFAVYQN